MNATPIFTGKLSILAQGLFVAAVVAVIARIAITRQYFGFNTETDTLGGFIPDAQRFLAGEPMHVFMHPPGYPLSLAALRPFFSDWFASGLFLSVAASVLVMVSSSYFYRRAISPAAGWGSIAALACSPVFISFSAFATSDLPFLALYSMVLAFAFTADHRDSRSLWAFTGIVFGCAILFRTNALPLVLIALVPLLKGNIALMRRAVCSGAFVAGALAPIGAWLMYAKFSGSNALPARGATINMALTYFRPEDAKAWGDGKAWAAETFGSALDVILYDPAHVIKTYASDLYQRLRDALQPDLLLAHPLVFFALPAFLYLLIMRQSRWVYYVLVLSAAQLLMVNLLVQDPRFLLFLVPLLGAACGDFIRRIYFKAPLDSASRKPLLALAYIAIGAILMLSLARSALIAENRAHRDEAELRSAVPTAQAIIGSCGIILARKPVLAFYTGAASRSMPRGRNLDDLVAAAAEASNDGYAAVYIYYGKSEETLRPEYRVLQNPASVAAANPELSLVAQGDDSAPWFLYLYNPAGLAEPGGDPRECR